MRWPGGRAAVPHGAPPALKMAVPRSHTPTLTLLPHTPLSPRCLSFPNAVLTRHLLPAPRLIPTPAPPVLPSTSCHLDPSAQVMTSIFDGRGTAIQFLLVSFLLHKTSILLPPIFHTHPSASQAFRFRSARTRRSPRTTASLLMRGASSVQPAPRGRAALRDADEGHQEPLKGLGAARLTRPAAKGSPRIRRSEESRRG